MQMKTISPQKTLWLSVTALLTVGIVLVSIFSLKNGYYDIFPYLYILPILLLAYFYPRYSVYFTVMLGWMFLGLVYLYGPADIRLYTSSFAFFYIFVSIGVVISAISCQLMQERNTGRSSKTPRLASSRSISNPKIRNVNEQAARILGYTLADLKTDSSQHSGLTMSRRRSL